MVSEPSHLDRTIFNFGQLLCLDNERGSVYIHETTPYANRDDVEVGAKECKYHKASSEKHKTFQVCNRKFCLRAYKGGSLCLISN